LSINNTDDLVDYGFYGQFVESAQLWYSGLYRSSANNKYYLAKFQTKPSSTVTNSYQLEDLYVNSLYGVLATNAQPNITSIGSFNGVLKATDGALSGNSTTDDIPEGKSNLYFTNNRVFQAITGSSPVHFDQLTGIISIDTSAQLTINGVISTTDIVGKNFISQSPDNVEGGGILIAAPGFSPTGFSANSSWKINSASSTPANLSFSFKDSLGVSTTIFEVVSNTNTLKLNNLTANSFLKLDNSKQIISTSLATSDITSYSADTRALFSANSGINYNQSTGVFSTDPTYDFIGNSFTAKNTVLNSQDATFGGQLTLAYGGNSAAIPNGNSTWLLFVNSKTLQFESIAADSTKIISLKIAESGSINLPLLTAAQYVKTDNLKNLVTVSSIPTSDIASFSTDVHALFSAGTGVTYNSSTGAISIGQDVATSAAPTFADVQLTNLTAVQYVKTDNLKNLTTVSAIPSSDISGLTTAIRTALSAGTGVTYNSTTGVISIGQDISTTSAPTFTTVQLSNLTISQYVKTDNLKNLVTVSSIPTSDIASFSADVRALFSAGTGVTYNSTTGAISIGQDVAVSASPTFNNITVSTVSFSSYLYADNPITNDKFIEYTSNGSLYFYNAHTTNTGFVPGTISLSYDSATFYCKAILDSTGKFYVANTINISALTASQYVKTDGSKNLVTVSSIPTSDIASFSTDVHALFSAGTGVTYNSSTGVIAIGQDVATSAAPTFTTVQLSNLTITQYVKTDASKNLVTVSAIPSSDISGLTTAIRTALSAGNGVTYNSTTGVISIGQDVSSSATPTFADVQLTNLTISQYVKTDASKNLVTVSSIPTSDIASFSADVHALFSAGTGVTYNSSTGAISIGQSVATTSAPTFADVQLTNLTAVQYVKTDASKNLVTVSSIPTSDIASFSADVHALFSAGTGVTYNSTTGAIAIGQDVAASASPTFSNLNCSVLKPTSYLYFNITTSTDRFIQYADSGNLYFYNASSINTQSISGFTDVLYDSLTFKSKAVIDSTGKFYVANTINISALTASQYVKTDSSKNLVTVSAIPSSDISGLTTAIRTALSAGTGVTYNSTTGVIAIGQDVATSAAPTFADVQLTGLTASQYVKTDASKNLVTVSSIPNSDISGLTTAIRTALSAGTGVTYNSSTGVIAIGQDISTTAAPTFADVQLTNLTATQYVKTDASKNLVTVSSIPTSDIASFSADVHALFSAGTGVTYNSTTGAISIGQSVATTATPTFDSISLTNYNYWPAASAATSYLISVTSGQLNFMNASTTNTQSISGITDVAYQTRTFKAKLSIDSTGVLSTININVSALSASQYVKTDASKNLVTVSSIPTTDITSFNSVVRGLLSGTNGVSYSSSTGVISLDSTYSPTFNNVIGKNFISQATDVTNGGKIVLGYGNSTAITAEGKSTWVLNVSSSNFQLYANTSAGATTNIFSVSDSGTFTFNILTASQYVKTDSSKNLVTVSSIPTSDIASFAADVHALFSAGTGVTYNSTTGAISIGQSVATTATPTFSGLTLTGFSGYVKSTAGVLSASTTIPTSDIASFTTDVRAQFTAGAGIAIVNGQISQDLTASETMTGLTVTNSAAQTIISIIDAESNTNESQLNFYKRRSAASANTSDLLFTINSYFRNSASADICAFKISGVITDNTSTSEDATTQFKNIAAGTLTTLITFVSANIQLNNITASSLLSLDSSKNIIPSTIGNSLSWATNTLDTIQDIRNTAAPTFNSLTLLSTTTQPSLTINNLQTAATEGQLSIYKSRNGSASSANDYYGSINFYFKNSTPTDTLGFRIKSQVTTVTASAENSTVNFDNISNGVIITLLSFVNNTIKLPQFSSSSLLGVSSTGQILQPTISSNLTYSLNTLDTIQNITTTAAPTFSGLSLTKTSVDAIGVQITTLKSRSGGAVSANDQILDITAAFINSTTTQKTGFEIAAVANSSTNTSENVTFSISQIISGTLTSVLSSDTSGNLTIAKNLAVTTITAGTWQATTIGTQYGGTGATSYTDGQLLIGNSSTSGLTKATLTSGNGITTTNGNGSITLAVAYNTTNLKITASQINTIQDIATSASPTFAGLTLVGLSGVLKASAGVISGSATTTDLTEGTNLYFTTARALSAVTATTITGILPVASGGTNISSYTIGDLIYASGTTTLAKLSGVATGNALISGGVGAAPSWGKINLTTHITGTLPVTSGGTGATSYTDGQLLIGNSSTSGLTTNTLAAGANISITNGNGLITIAATSSSTITALNIVNNAANSIAKLYNSAGGGTGYALSNDVSSGALLISSTDNAGTLSNTLASISSTNLVTIGSNAATTALFNVAKNSYNTTNTFVSIEGSIIGTASTNTKYGISNTLTIAPTYTLSAITSAFGDYTNITFALAASVVVTTAASIYVDAGSIAGNLGTITTGYSLYIKHPTFGATKYTAVLGDASNTLVGVGTATPAYMLDIAGQAQINPAITSSASTAMLIITGNLTGTTSNSQYSIKLTPTLTSTTTGIGSAYSFYNNTTFVGTTPITTAYGIYCDIGSSSGTVTTGYALYVKQPAYGATKYTAVLGDTTSTLVGVGTATPACALDINGFAQISTTQTVSSATNILSISATVTITSSAALAAISNTTVLKSSTSAATALYGYYSNISTNGTAVTPTLAASMYLDAGATSGNNPTTGYSLYVKHPNFGTTKYTAVIGDASTALVGIGNSTPAYMLDVTGQIRSNPTISTATTGLAALILSGTMTSTAAIVIAAISNTTALTSITTGATSVYGYYANHSITGTATITTAYSLFLDTGATSGTITTGYSLYVKNPAYGTTKYTAVIGDASTALVGIGTATPAYMLDVSGQIRANPTISTTTTGLAAFMLTGTMTSTAAINIAALRNTTALTSTTVGATAVYGYYANHSITGTTTITSAYTLYLDAGATSGTITTGYSLYVKHPSFGTTKYTAIIGDASTTLVGIGTATPAYMLDVSGQVQVNPTISTATTGLGALIVNGVITTTAAITTAGIANLADFTSITTGATSVYGYYANHVITGTATITSAYTLYLDAGTTSGTITTGYSMYVKNPAYGTTKYTAVIGDASNTLVGVGTATPAYMLDVSGQIQVNPTISTATTGLAALILSGTMTSTAAITIAGIKNTTAITSITTGATSVYGYYANHSITGTATITTAYTLYLDAGTTSGTITTGYSLYIKHPAYGTTKYTAIIGDASTALVGIGTATPAYMLDVSGQIRANPTVSTATTNTGAFMLIGTMTSTAAITIAAVRNTTAITSITTGATAVYGYYANHTITGTATITAAYTLYLDTGATSGTITTGYSLYVKHPSYGTTKYTAIIGDASNALVGIGNSTPAYMLDVTGQIRANPAISTATTGLAALILSGTMTATAAITIAAISNTTALTSTTIGATSVYGYYSNHSITGTTTITSAYTLYLDAGTTSGTITTGYSLYVKHPSYGTTKYTAIIGDASTALVGIGTTAPAYMLDVTGQIRANPTISTATTGLAAFILTGTMTSTAAITIAAIRNTTAITSTTIGATSVYGYYANHSITGTTTIISAYTLYLDAGVTSGTITTGYSLYVKHPAYGTTKYTAIIGDASTTLVGIGTATPAYTLDISGQVQVNPNVSTATTGLAALVIAGTMTSIAAISIAAISNTTALTSITTGAANVYGYYANHSITGTATITAAYSLFLDVGSASGTITSGYSLYVKTPNFGTTKYTAVLGDSSTTLVGIGKSNPSYMLDINGQIRANPTISISSALTGILFINAAVTTTAAIDFASIRNTTSITATTLTASAVYGYYANHSITGTSTITAAYTLYLDAGATSGTITTGYGLYVKHPAYGTTKYTAIIGDASTALVGIGTATPTYMLDVSGQIRANPTISTATTGLAALILSGTMTSTAAITIAAIRNTTAITSTTAGATAVYGYYSSNTVTATAVTISAYYALYVDVGSATGTITASYSLYVKTQSFGSTAYTAILGDAAGTLVGVGTATPAKTLDVSGTFAVSSTVTLSSLTASRLVYTDASKNLASVTLSSNLTLTGSTLDTAQSIQTTSSVTFNSILSSNQITATTYVAANTNLVCNSSSSTEGGQIVLAYGNITGLTSEAASTWNIDVSATSTFRIFRKNASNVAGNALYIDETTAITMPFYTGASYLKTDGSGLISCSSATFTTDVRAQLSAGTGVTYSSGQISIGQSVATSANPTFAGATFTSNVIASSGLSVRNGSTLQIGSGPSTGIDYYTSISQSNGLLILDSFGDTAAGAPTTRVGTILMRAYNNVSGSQTIATTFKMDESGHVGVNNTSPSYELDVTGSCRVTSVISVGTTPATSTIATINMASASLFGVKTIGTVTSAASAISGVYSNFTLSLAASNANNVYGIASAPIFAIASTFSATGILAAYYATYAYTGNAGTISSAYGFYFDGGGALVGTAVTKAYGGYFTNPAAGTQKTALYADNLSIGLPNTAPPTNGLIISGVVGIGTANTSSALQINSSFSGNGASYYGALLSNTFTNTGGATATSMTELYISYTVVATNAITSVYGIFVDVGSGSGAGGVTTSYGLYCNTPSFGTAKYTAIFTGGTTLVGVGTATPAKTLDVLGTFAASSTVTLASLTASRLVYTDASKNLTSAAVSANLTFSGGTLDTIQNIQTTSTPTFSNLVVGNVLSSSSFAGIAYSGFNNGSSYCIIQDSIGNTLVNCVSGMTLYFRCNNSDLLTLTSSAANMLVSCSISSLGTSTPQLKVNNTDTNGATSESRIVFAENGFYYQGIGGVYNSGNQYMSFSVSGSANTWQQVASMWKNGGLSVGTTAYSVQAPTNGLLVQANVIIGSSTSGVVYSGENLQVVGSAVIGATTASTTGMLRFVSNSSVNYIQSGLSSTTGSSAPLLFSNMNNGTEFMRLTTTGYLGINTSAPSSFLETICASDSKTAKGTYNGAETAIHGLQVSSGHTVSSDYTLYMGADSVAHCSYIQSVQWGTATAALLLNARGGNVGIGINNSSPSYTLDVLGNCRVTSTFTANNSIISKGFFVSQASDASEGGQLVLGYGNNTSITGQANSSWNFDVFNSDLRIFAISSTGTITVAIQITETGTVTIPTASTNALLYTDGSKNLTNATVNSTLSFSSGTLGVSTSAMTSGTYTPTLTNAGNVTTLTLLNVYYTRNLNVITVIGAIHLTFTGSVGSFLFDLTLPVNAGSNFSTGYEVIGNATSAFSNSVSIQGLGYINARTGFNNKCRITFYYSASYSGGSDDIYFTLSYTV
jgi:hypothetical protein